MHQIAHKLSWRLRLLLDPAGFAEAEPFFRERDDFPIRKLLLAEARTLSLADRLAYADPRSDPPEIGDYLLARRLRVGGRGPYYDLGDHLIHVPPGGEEGARLVLREAYVDGADFFSGAVDVRAGDTVLDVGANVGTSALIFSARAGERGRVHSFEPVFHHALRATLDANGTNNVTVVPAAVADRSGSATFSVTTLGVDSRLRAPNFAGGRAVEVPVTTLDAYVAEQQLSRVDFVKLDIEGAEERAIRGARELIQNFRPRWSIASYHTDPEGDPQHPKLVALLRGHGYTLRERGARHIYAW